MHYIILYDCHAACMHSRKVKLFDRLFDVSIYALRHCYTVNVSCWCAI